MPINYKNYPDNWRKEIRPAILLRANYQCEFCGVKQYAVGERCNKGIFHPTSGNEFANQAGNGELFYAEAKNFADTHEVDYDQHKFIVIVLTIAHIDHNINNNDPANLKALCQRCHLIHDKHQHMKSRRETIKRKKGLIELDFTTQNIP